MIKHISKQVQALSILNNIFEIDNKTNSIEEKEDINNNNDHKAFNNLLQLQLLIQKHSGLKELCK